MPEWWTRFKAGFRHAFALGVKEELAPEETAVLEKIADRIRRRGLALPAVVFLESTRPLNMLGSQVMIGLQPFVEIVASTGDYETLAAALEKRVSIDILIRLLEAEKPDAGERT
jgi:hypothetical protein